MLNAITTMLLSLLAATSFNSTTAPKTPKTWLDSRIEKLDRLTMEQMISYAPPTLPTKADWVLPENINIPRWSDMRGRVVVVQSWTNAIPEGRLAISAVMKVIADSKSPNDVVLLTIHTPDKHGAARSYMKKKSLDPRTLIDPTGEVCNSLGFYKDPASIVIDRNGVVRYVGLRTNGVRHAIKKLLGEKYNPKDVPKTYKSEDKKIDDLVVYPKHSANYGKATNMQGKSAPKFYVKEWLSGRVDVRNKVHLVEFWATWCPPCKKSIPHLNKIAKHFGDDIAIVGVTAEPDSTVLPFMKKTPMIYGVASDPKKTMQAAIACRAIPLLMVISSDGIVRWQGNPIAVTTQIIQQVIDADKGVLAPSGRGRWDITKDHD